MKDPLILTVLRILVAHADKGAPIDLILKEANCSGPQLYTAVHAIRDAKNIPIKLKDRNYFINAEKAQEYINNPTAHKSGPKSSTDKEPRPVKNLMCLTVPVPKNIHRLPPDKRSDFIDLLSKADFYYRCARGVIESCMATENLFVED